MKTSKEIEVERKRQEQIAEVVKWTEPTDPELAMKECRKINRKVAKWKIKHPELVKDEIPF